MDETFFLLCLAALIGDPCHWVKLINSIYKIYRFILFYSKQYYIFLIDTIWHKLEVSR